MSLGKLLLAVVLMSACLSGGPAVARAPEPPTVSPKARIAGETVTVTGALPTHFARIVRLQGKVAGSWKTLATRKSKPSGKVTFTTTSAATAVRLAAPKVRRGGKKYAAYTSPARAVGLQVQNVAVSLPASAVAGETVHASVTVTPFRSGRVIRLQGLGPGGWTDVAPSDPGVTSVALFSWIAELGVTKFRAVVAGLHGAPALVSPTKPVTVTPAPPAAGVVKVSQAAGGGPSWGESSYASVSADGRYVAFQSGAGDLVAGEGNPGFVNILLRDQQTGLTTRVSRPIDANAVSGVLPVISADGNWVTFQSEHPLVAADTNGQDDVYLFNRVTETTTLVSRAAGSSDGGDSDSNYPTISGDGNLVAYETYASDIVDRGLSPAYNVVIWNRTTGATTLVSDAPGSDFANGFSNYPAIAADGSAVVFQSAATNLLATSTAATPNQYDVFRVPLSGGLPSGPTTLVSHVPADLATPGDGSSTEPTISGDGRFVGYESDATDLAGVDNNTGGDIFVWDATAPEATIRVTNPGTYGSDSGQPAFSVDGSTLAFESNSPDLISGDSGFGYDVFRWRRATGVLDLVSRTDAGGFPDANSLRPSISQDGSYVAFHSGATDLATGDPDPLVDVFLFHG